jgi:hypothetical protein
MDHYLGKAFHGGVIERDDGLCEPEDTAASYFENIPRGARSSVVQSGTFADGPSRTARQRDWKDARRATTNSSPQIVAPTSAATAAARNQLGSGGKHANVR